MSRRACRDCGTGLTSYGACPNCHEETVILTEQSEYITEPVSDAFADKVREQAKPIRENQRSELNSSKEARHG